MNDRAALGSVGIRPLSAHGERVAANSPAIGKSILVPLRRPTLRRLVSAQFLAEAADGVVHVTLPLYVLAETGSPIAMSLTFFAEMVGAALLGVVGGVLADRFDRLHVLRASFLLRALFLVAAWASAPVLLTITLGVSARAFGQLDNPSFDALIPDQAESDAELQPVLSLRRFIQSVSVVVGPAIGAVSVWALDAKRTLAIAAALFAAAIAIHMTLHGLDRGAKKRRLEHHGSNWLNLAAGMSVVMTTPFVRRLVLYWVLSLVTVAVAMAACAVWYEDTLRLPEYWYGISVSAYGVGAAGATLVFGGRQFQMSLPAVLLAAAPVYALTCALCVAAPVPWLFPMGWLLWGIALGPEIVRAEPEFVKRINPSSLGRAYAGLGVALTLGLALGYLVAGPLLDRFGARTTTLVAAVAIVAIGAMWLGPAVRHEGRFDETLVELVPADTHLPEERAAVS